MDGDGGIGIRVQDTGSDHQIVSNAISYAGSGSWRCLQANLATSSYTDIDNNICTFPNASFGEWEDGTGTSPDPLSAWQLATGFGGSSQHADPGFADPAAGDLRSGSASAAMVDAGHPSLSAPDSIDGCTRDAAPDSGAHEWGTVFCDDFEGGDTTSWSVTTG